MKKLKEIFLLENLIGKKLILKEDKVSDLKTLYVDKGKISLKTFNKLVGNQPTYKFLQWSVKQAILYPKHLKKILEVVNYFLENEKRLKSKGWSDLQSYSLSEALRVIALSSVEEIPIVEGARFIGAYNNKFLYLILNRESSIKYGSNTKWCIAASISHNYWEDYIKNYFFFLLDKEVHDNVNEKIAIQIKKINFDEKENYLGFEAAYWNQKDDPINYKLPPELKELIDKEIGSKENLKKIDELKKMAKVAESEKSILYKKREKVEKKLDSLYYLKKGIDVPRDLVKSKSLDLRDTNITDLRNLEELEELIVNEVIVSLGKLKTITHFADFRGASRLVNFSSLKEVNEVYVNDETNSKLKNYLKTITNNYNEL